MIALSKRILAFGGLLLVMAMTRLLLLVLCPLFVGLTLGISAEQVLCRIAGVKVSRKNLSGLGLSKRKQTGGGGS
jgi:hypothetical protein